MPVLFLVSIVLLGIIEIVHSKVMIKGRGSGCPVWSRAWWWAGLAWSRAWWWAVQYGLGRGEGLSKANRPTWDSGAISLFYAAYRGVSGATYYILGSIRGVMWGASITGIITVPVTILTIVGTSLTVLYTQRHPARLSGRVSVNMGLCVKVALVLFAFA